MVKNAGAAVFAVKTNFLNPIFGVEKNKEYREMEEKIADKTGRMPRSYAEVTYDALRVAAVALESHETENDTSSLRNDFIQSANSYTGVTGLTELNDAGDRKSGSYDFWAVRVANQKDEGGYHDSPSFKWANVATSESR